MSDTRSLPILTALNAAYARIRELHPEVPEAVIVVGQSGRKRNAQVHGHFQPAAWYDSSADEDNGGAEIGEQHEIMLSGESLARGAYDTLATLIHEATHAAAHAQNVKDTSNNGRYHNKRFRDMGQSFGIMLEQDGTLGWSHTRLSMAGKLLYKRELDALAIALSTYRLPDEPRAVKPRTKTKGVIDCGCEDPVTVSLSWFSRHEDSLKCDDCFEPFHIVEEG